VVVTQKMGRVSGTVLDANGKAASGASIVIFPEDSALWMPASRFIRIARPDADGRFSLSAMPAGGYLAIAQAFIENGQWEDPAFLEAARDTAVRFVLMEGGAETITLKLPAAR
jgi:hypothetical protein